MSPLHLDRFYLLDLFLQLNLYNFALLLNTWTHTHKHRPDFDKIYWKSICYRVVVSFRSSRDVDFTRKFKHSPPYSECENLFSNIDNDGDDNEWRKNRARNRIGNHLNWNSMQDENLFWIRCIFLSFFFSFYRQCICRSFW